MARLTIAALSMMAVFMLAAAGALAQAAQTCDYSASAPIALGDAEAEHTLLLFWAGEHCNAAVSGRAVFDADGHVIYMFIEDPNRLRIKEPGIEPHPDDFAPPLAEALAQELALMERTGAIGEYPSEDVGIYPKIEAADWERARRANLPMMCHSTGYSVQACLWLNPASGQMEILLERGS